MTQKYSLSELSVLSETPARTIRFYIQKGLLPPPEGQRRGATYHQQHLERLVKIRNWQQAGLSLQAITELFETEDTPPPLPKINQGEIRVCSHINLGAGIELVIDPSLCQLSQAQLRTLAQTTLATISSLKEEHHEK